MSRLEQLDETYREHHETRRSRDFVFGGADRASVFREWVGGPGRRVLDVGCRYGAMTRAYAAGNDVVGMDVDKEALVEAAKLGIDTLWADATEPFPQPDASFDVVVAGELLEHLPMPDRTVAEVRRVLKPGGWFVGSVPNAYRLKNRLVFLAGKPPETDPTHLRMFSPALLGMLLAGFEQLQLRFVAGRLVPLHPRLFANVMAFRARKPS
jgi:2-polyprenyl-3-methyl-5-hydroxy-6-metoxy-1,4-benzoquinol methylase